MSRKRRTAADEPFLVIRSSSANPCDGELIGEHSHDWHQLIYASAGLMTVWTEAGSWVAPPSRAVWVPAGVRHSIRFVGESAFRTLYVRPEASSELPAQCTSVSVSPLLRELILRTVEVGMLDQRATTEAALATLILAEFRTSTTSPFTLPRPHSAALRQATQLLERAPSTSLSSLAQTIGLGKRTLERRFVGETGLTVGRWRQQRVLLGALEALAAGQSVKQVAGNAGYSSPSAFVAAFRKHLGTTPARYFS